MILDELFANVAEFRNYVPYAESNISFQEMNSSAYSAKKQVIIILSKDVYDKLKIDNGEPKKALCSAMANLTLAKQLIFGVINFKKSDKDVYKYELEAMKRAYIENYYNAMDSLIQLLDDDNVIPVWTDTKYKKMISTLQIKTTEEFDGLYPIDLSYLFFFRSIPLQKEALEEVFTSYFDRAKDKEEAMLILKRCLAKQTVSIALRRFDIIEFPATIRNLFDDSTAGRTGKDEQTRMLEISAGLSDEVQRTLRDLDLLLTDSGGSVETETSFNRADDKIYLLG